MAPIHRHLGAQEIPPDLNNSYAKGTGQAIGQPGLDGFGGSGALPNGHVKHLVGDYSASYCDPGRKAGSFRKLVI
jgi:hypothetical protein